MSESMQWIKLSTDVFENRKIQYLLSQSSGDSTCLIWFRLLTLAGQYGTSGELLLCEGVPYDAEMLARKFGYPEDLAGADYIQTVLDLFVKLKMLNFDGVTYSIASWKEYQAVKELDKKRQAHAEAQARYRKKKSREQSLANHSTESKNSGLPASVIDGDITQNHGDTNVTLQSKSKSKNICNLTNVKLCAFSSEIDEIVNYLNAKTGKHFSPKTAETQKHITARLNEGYTIEDFKRVIDTKVADWSSNPHMAQYLRPKTLFLPSNFEGYLNQNGAASPSNDYNQDWGF